MEFGQIVRQLHQLTAAIRSPVAAIHDEDQGAVDTPPGPDVEHRHTVASAPGSPTPEHLAPWTGA